MKNAYILALVLAFASFFGSNAIHVSSASSGVLYAQSAYKSEQDRIVNEWKNALSDSHRKSIVRDFMKMLMNEDGRTVDDALITTMAEENYDELAETLDALASDEVSGTFKLFLKNRRAALGVSGVQETPVSESIYKTHTEEEYERLGKETTDPAALDQLVKEYFVDACRREGVKATDEEYTAYWDRVDEETMSELRREISGLSNEDTTSSSSSSSRRGSSGGGPRSVFRIVLLIFTILFGIYKFCWRRGWVE